MLAAPLKISLRPSRALTVVLVVAHAYAIAMIAIVPIALWLQMACGLLLALNCLFWVRRTALLQDTVAVVAIEIGADNILNVRTKRGDYIECEVLPSTYVVSYLSVLNLREIDCGKVRHVIVASDSADAGDFRNLRTWLRWKGAPRSD
jgi:toxin CptA